MADADAARRVGDDPGDLGVLHHLDLPGHDRRRLDARHVARRLEVVGGDDAGLVDVLLGRAEVPVAEVEDVDPQVERDAPDEEGVALEGDLGVDVGVPRRWQEAADGLARLAGELRRVAGLEVRLDAGVDLRPELLRRARRLAPTGDLRVPPAPVAPALRLRVERRHLAR